MKTTSKKPTKKVVKNKIPNKLILAGISLEEIGLGALVRIEINTKDKTTTVELMKGATDFLNLTSKDLKR